MPTIPTGSTTSIEAEEIIETFTITGEESPDGQTPDRKAAPKKLSKDVPKKNKG